jgi:selenocysteine-specific elongation factor
VPSLILGTAGHIDHGKTALVLALTGVDTDRLAEEKARGITIDLGFADLQEGELRLGIVDVPGHEGFVKNMLAGATGMDVVLLIVAADEGVMPQTREHHAILRLLGVEQVVVALTKADLVDPEWLELAREDVRELLAGGPFADAPIVPTSSVTGDGLEELRAEIRRAATRTRPGDPDDLAVLPVDRVFSVRGTGTVVTGTLWSGRLRVGEKVRVEPGSVDARIRGLQVHGADTDSVDAGHRVAVALTGEGVDVEALRRGQTLVTLPDWEPSPMLTVRVRVLEDSSWALDQGQRVRVHVGTAEVMARCALLGIERVGPGEEGWVQLRLEAPVVARAGQRLVLRSYSPVITFAGGEVVEVHPPKRRVRANVPGALLAAVRSPGPGDALAAILELAGVEGVRETLLPVLTGLNSRQVKEALEECTASGALLADGRWVGADAVREHRQRVLDEIRRVHLQEPFRPGAPLEALRALAPTGAPRGFTDVVLKAAAESGEAELREGAASLAGFQPSFSPEQQALRASLVGIYREAGLSPPTLDELPEQARSDPAFLALVRALEADGTLVALEPDLLVDAGSLDEGIRRTRDLLGGAGGLGPADFREALPVSRRYLLPLLRHLDRIGVTRNSGDVREVPQEDGGS